MNGPLVLEKGMGLCPQSKAPPIPGGEENVDKTLHVHFMTHGPTNLERGTRLNRLQLPFQNNAVRGRDIMRSGSLETCSTTQRLHCHSLVPTSIFLVRNY